MTACDKFSLSVIQESLDVVEVVPGHLFRVVQESAEIFVAILLSCFPVTTKPGHPGLVVVPSVAEFHKQGMRPLLVRGDGGTRFRVDGDGGAVGNEIEVVVPQP